jgi:hypothetical protein
MNNDNKNNVQKTDKDNYPGKVSTEDEVGSTGTWSLVVKKKDKNSTSHHNTKNSTSHHNTKISTSHHNTKGKNNKVTFTKLTTL